MHGTGVKIIEFGALWTLFSHS